MNKKWQFALGGALIGVVGSIMAILENILGIIGLPGLVPTFVVGMFFNGMSENDPASGAVNLVMGVILFTVNILFYGGIGLLVHALRQRNSNKK